MAVSGALLKGESEGLSGSVSLGGKPSARHEWQTRTMSFESLTKRISPMLKRITHKLNGHYTFFNDEDLYQEALMRLWTDFREGSLHDKTDSYILQGCYYHLKNYIRKTRDNVLLISLTTPISEDGKTIEESLPAEETDFFEHLDGKLQIEASERCLTGREKEVLSLLMEGMSMREIGARLGISHVMVLKIRNKIRGKYSKFVVGDNLEPFSGRERQIHA